MAHNRHWAIALTISALVAASGHAAVIDGTNWADHVHEHSTNIQNYNGVLVGETTEWWLSGPADADGNDNGYIWDPEDQDTVGGWRSTHPDEYIIMGWDLGIPDLQGDDLSIHLYGGPGAAANVFAGVSADSLELIGVLGGGTPGYLTEQGLDFNGRFSDDVHYVMVERTASGPQTGMFFDAFAGHVPEPGTLALLAFGTLGLVRRHRA